VPDLIIGWTVARAAVAHHLMADGAYPHERAPNGLPEVVVSATGGVVVGGLSDWNVALPGMSLEAKRGADLLPATPGLASMPDVVSGGTVSS
jgi:hypothetical protein